MVELQFPDVHRDAELPERVTVYEVGPRDGLQAEVAMIPVEIKAEFCRRLIDAGIGTLEVTSFVSPKWVPQLADAEDLMARLQTTETLAADRVRSVVLTPNMRGSVRALAAGAGEVAVFVSATETFAEKNLNMTVAQAMENAAAVIEHARAAGIAVRGYVSMCFGDPWEGRVPPTQVVEVAQRLFELGVQSVSLGDTIGVATPGHVKVLLEQLLRAGVPAERVAMHFHDTYGQALANVYAALHCGIVEFDSSAGGLGRCPYAKGATGNLATEDLVWMLHGLGIQTGIDLDALVATTQWMSAHIGHPPASRVATALIAANS